MKKLILSLLVAVGLIGSASAAMVTFENPNDLTGNFTPITSAGLNRYTQTTTGGVGNSGAIGFTTVSTDDTTQIFNQQSFDFSQVGAALQLSMFVKVTPINGGVAGLGSELSRNTFLELGFSANSTTGFSLATVGNEFISIGMTPSEDMGTTFDVFQRYGHPSGGSGTSGLAYGLTLLPGHFYKLAAEFTNLGVSGLSLEYPTLGVSYSGKMTLDDYGTDGTTKGDNILSRTFVDYIGSGTIGGDGTVWAGFLSASANGANGLDNFSVISIPEPSTYALFGLGAVGMLMVMRRKKTA